MCLIRRQIREIRIVDLIAYTVPPAVAIGIIIAACVLCVQHFESLHPAIFIAPTVLVVYILLKFFVIGLVLLYKAFAPMSLRDRCRFHPTCSTYMIMAIQKYGLAIGLFKGIRRITRCRPPNSGTDFP